DCEDVRELVSFPTASTAAFSPTTTTTAAALTGNHRPCFIHNDCTTQKVAAVAGFDGVIRLAIIVNFDKTEPARFAGKAVAHYIYAIDGNTSLTKEICQIGFSSRVWQISNKQFHSMLLDFIGVEADSRLGTRKNQESLSRWD